MVWDSESEIYYTDFETNGKFQPSELVPRTYAAAWADCRPMALNSDDIMNKEPSGSAN